MPNAVLNTEAALAALPARAEATRLTMANFLPLLHRGLLEIYLVSDRWAEVLPFGIALPRPNGSWQQRLGFIDRRGELHTFAITDEAFTPIQGLLRDPRWFRINPDRLAEL